MSNNTNIEEEFVDSLLRIFETKIFPTHKLNFMQYFPFYIMSLSKINDKCRLFTEKLLSFLIVKAFNCL